MKPHLFSTIWSPMTGQPFDDLKADIAAHGLLVPGVSYQGMTLDGRNRERACAEVGVPMRYEDAKVESEADALALVISLNEHRRHMTPEERAFAAARLANILNGDNKFVRKVKLEGSSIEIPSSSDATKQRHAISLMTAADTLKVSHASAKRARAILAYAGEDGAAEVVSGKVSLAKKCDAVRPPRPLEPKPEKRKPGRPRKDASKRPVGRPEKRLIFATTKDTPSGLTLTPEQVDPEFVGSSMDFTDLYGHVQVMTAEQYATARFNAWASNMKALATRARDLPDWPKVDHNWLRSPSARDITRLAEAIAALRPKLDEAEALLRRAEEAVIAKRDKQGEVKPAGTLPH